MFGEHLPQVPVSSTKSATGHLLGAAGGVESIFTIMATINDQPPATLNLEQADEGLEDLDLMETVIKSV